MRRRVRWSGAFLVAATAAWAPAVARAAPAAPAPATLAGPWEGPLGLVTLSQNGADVTGVLAQANSGCGLEAGATVLTGALLDDNLTGELSLCLAGEGAACRGTEKAFVLLLVTGEGKKLSGAAHVATKGCTAQGLTPAGGVELVRSAPGKAGGGPRGPVMIGSGAGGYDPRGERKAEPAASTWDAAAREGEQLLQAGLFERARKRFQDAIALDPTRAEAYNGVGVTFYARRLYADAKKWYGRAIEANPDYGDAYYNLACLAALQGKKPLALRYLKISVLNGYRDLQTLREDPDLESLRGDAEFEKLAGGAPGATEPAKEPAKEPAEPKAAEPAPPPEASPVGDGPGPELKDPPAR